MACLNFQLNVEISYVYYEYGGNVHYIIRFIKKVYNNLAYQEVSSAQRSSYKIRKLHCIGDIKKT